MAPPAADEPTVLERLLDTVEGRVPSEPVALEALAPSRAAPSPAARPSKGALVSAGLHVLVEALADDASPAEPERVDRVLLDRLIADLDERIGRQLDEILHHDAFQQLESSWRGLKFLVDRTDVRRNVQVELLNASKADLKASFDEAPDLLQSPLYRQVYANAYDQPGADPYAAVVSDYAFDSSSGDVALLRHISRVAASAHCPFVGSVGPRFFGMDSMEAWRRIPDLEAYLSTADFAAWNAFRETEDARYVGLTLPRFLLRLPYGPDGPPVRSFAYTEGVRGRDHGRYLWGRAAFAFAANLVGAFVRDGWCVQIRGPQSGGRVDALPVHRYDVGRGTETKIPTEVPISETLEFAASRLGFIPLSVYQGRDYACFFSAHSAQKPRTYTDPAATANSRINARLPYVLLASRIAHYLKVLQRENIGATKDAQQVEAELNDWVATLVTRMPTPSDALVAKYPLRDARVSVRDVEGSPGFYRTALSIIPHFQVEGLDVTLSMVGQLPKG
jgi:type VI secretion system protein ImpC